METINQLPTDISTDLTYRQGIITLNITKGDYEATRTLQFNSFEDMLIVKVALEEALGKAGKYGLLNLNLEGQNNAD